jgi:hypothetical protein
MNDGHGDPEEADREGRFNECVFGTAERLSSLREMAA